MAAVGVRDTHTPAVDQKEQRPMQIKRIARSLVVAGTAAALSILSVVASVMASTGGGDFPR